MKKIIRKILLDILRRTTTRLFYGASIDIQLKIDDIKVIRKYVNSISDDNCYVEIGTKYSGSALLAKTAIKQGVEIFTIDPVDERYHFTDKSRADKLDKELGIHFINKTSLDAVKKWDKPIGVLFIDGDHTKAGEDFLAWEKFVVPGGIILFHDYINDPAEKCSVIDDCKSLVLTNKNYEIIHVPNLHKDKRLRGLSEDTSILQLRKNV